MADRERKPLPHNLEAEQAVLAAMILDKDIVEEALARINADAFHRQNHQKIFEAIAELSEQGTPVDQLTLADKLEAKGELELVGGRPYIVELAYNSFALANWRNHIDIVKRDALLRDLVRTSNRIMALGLQGTDDVDAVIEEAEKELFTVTNKRVSATFKPIKELLHESLDLIDEMAKNRSHILGVPTGFNELDNLLAGMRAGDLLILAARPGVGKTSLALNIAINAARQNTSVAFFSLEMPSAQLAQRILCSEAKVSFSSMRRGRLSDADYKLIVDACETLSKCTFAIDDSPGLSILELRAKARRQLRKVTGGNGLIVVDYLQLMQSRNSSSDQQRYLEVGEISRGLKVLAKELGVPILALSQLSRAVESRTDKRPQLSDLRESGSIEQDADVVMFIDRSTSEEEAEKPNRPDFGVANLMVAKHRNGALADIQLSFIPEYTTYRSLYIPPASQAI